MFKEYVEELEEAIAPNTFITLTMRQGITNSAGAFIAGNANTYDRMFKALLRSVTRRLWGKRALRRNAERLPNLATLEGKFSNEFHIHCCLRLPAHVSLQEFTRIFAECWRESLWYRPNFKVEDYLGGGVAYILKEGQDAILLGSSQGWQIGATARPCRR